MGILWNGEIKGNSTTHCVNLVLTLHLWDLDFNPWNGSARVQSTWSILGPIWWSISGWPNTSLCVLQGSTWIHSLLWRELAEEATFLLLQTFLVGFLAPQTCVFYSLFDLYHNPWKITRKVSLTWKRSFVSFVMQVYKYHGTHLHIEMLTLPSKDQVRNYCVG